jgi:superfamily II DNA or RNA helicase
LIIKNFRNNNIIKVFCVYRKKFCNKQKPLSRVLKDNNFGDLWVDGIEPKSNEYLCFGQTLNNRLKDLNLSPHYYDFIILDEAHHGPASSYRPI